MSNLQANYSIWVGTRHTHRILHVTYFDMLLCVYYNYTYINFVAKFNDNELTIILYIPQNVFINHILETATVKLLLVSNSIIILY